MIDELPRLMLVTDRRRTAGRDLVDLVAAAVRGGLRLLQVREKESSPEDRLRLVAEIRERIPTETTILVNGDLATARRSGSGLHLAAADRQPWNGAQPPSGLLFGRSVHDLAEARAARDTGAGYLVAGNVYDTASKPGRAGRGTELIRSIATLVSPVPLFAIGGVTASRVPELLRAGCHGVAVCGALLEALDPEQATREFRRQIDEATG